MDVENTFIKPVLKSYFDKGFEEYEAHKEISDKYGPRAITPRTINKWFTKFRISNIRSLNLANSSKQKFTDEFLIDLVNNNPGLNMAELAKLANTAASTISTRLKQVNSKGEKAKYICKNIQANNLKSCNRQKKFTDEFLIELVKKNPNFTLKELAAHADVSLTTIVNRMKQINIDGEKVKYISKRAQFAKEIASDEYLLESVSDDPSPNMAESENLTGAPKQTISRKVQQINDLNTKKCCIKKSTRVKKTKFTDEYLINLINENPNLNMRELSNLAGSSISTISKRLKQINSNGEKVKYINKY